MSQNISLIIKNGNCFINGEFKDQDILIENGKIKTIGKVSHLNSSNVYDATGQTVIPGVIDTQVHFREPGSSQGSNGSLTITRAEQNVGIWYSGAIESDSPNAEGSITIEVLSDGSSKIIWSDKGDLPPLTGLLAMWLNSSLGAKFAEDLHRLSQLEPSDSGGR